MYPNLNLPRDDHTEHVAVFGGDHIYKFAIDQMEESHRERNADLRRLVKIRLSGLVAEASGWQGAKREFGGPSDR